MAPTFIMKEVAGLNSEEKNNMKTTNDPLSALEESLSNGPHSNNVLIKTWDPSILQRKQLILLSRHGETENNLLGVIGGDSKLTNRGSAYALALADYVNSFEFSALQLWTSTLSRTVETTAGVKAFRREAKSELNEIYAGLFEELTYEEVKTFYPKEYALRELNKYTYKYPRGESYVDVTKRIKWILTQIENNLREGNQEAMLICTHQAVLRCIFGELLHINSEQLPYLNIPLHTIMWLSRENVEDQWQLSLHKLPIEGCDTWRPKQDNSMPSDQVGSKEESWENVPDQISSDNSLSFALDGPAKPIKI